MTMTILYLSGDLPPSMSNRHPIPAKCGGLGSREEWVQVRTEVRTNNVRLGVGGYGLRGGHQYQACPAPPPLFLM